jgi:hypothetical protein
MAFGMKAPPAGDFAEIVKYDARAGRLFRMDYDPVTKEKTPVDVTTPAPRFAVDFGSLEVGYAHFAPTGPDFRMVAEGHPLPEQPTEKDLEGKLKFRPAFRVKIYGKILLGLRELASAANVVTASVEDLYHKYQAAAEAQAGKIPIVELTRTMPIQMGKGTRQSVVYAPCFAIVGWTDRVPEMGPRTVAPPLGAPRTSTPPDGDRTISLAQRQQQSAAAFEPQGVTSAQPLPKTQGGGTMIDDEIPF